MWTQRVESNRFVAAGRRRVYTVNMTALRPAQTPPRLPGKRPWPLSPVLVTALVYPGAGQLMQRRWVAGGLAIAAFTAAGGWFFVRTGRVLIDYYRMAFDFAGAPESQVRPRDIVVPFIVALVVYVACLVDAAVAEYHLRRNASAAAAR